MIDEYTLLKFREGNVDFLITVFEAAKQWAEENGFQEAVVRNNQEDGLYEILVINKKNDRGTEISDTGVGPAQP